MATRVRPVSRVRAKPTATKPAAARTRTHKSALTTLRRQEIVQAAIKVFSRRGFEAARAEDIAAAANIAKGTLYLYFRSKEALYSAAITHAVGELQTLSAERIGAAKGFREKVGAAIDVRLHFWTGHETIYRLLMTLGREPRHRRQTNDLLRSGQQHLLSIFAEGTGAGEIADIPYESLAWAILDMVRGATERRMDRVTEATVEEDAANITAYVLRTTGLN